MILKILRYMHGYVKIKISGYSPERFLNLCRHHRIYIWGLHPADNAYEMYLSLEDFKKLRPIVRKTHTHLILSGRFGFPFFLHKYKKRKFFSAGIFLCAAIIYFCSCFIWDIRFEGNEKWTDPVLLDFLKSRDISPAMLKSNADCAQIISDIREEYNDIVWVSASIEGSCLKIQIKENDEVFPEVEAESPSDLIATEDGTITSMITRSGTPLVHIGDEVKKGDILVSGKIGVLNDSGEVTSYEYVQADADIFADTQYEYHDSMPLTYEEKHYEKEEQRFLFYIKAGNLRFSFGTEKHSFSCWERYSSESGLKLGENFYLPVTYGKIQIKSYTTSTENYTKSELRQKLTEKFNQFSEELEEKGIQIRQNSVKIHLNENSAAAEGVLYLNQRITESADTEIVEMERNKQNESSGTDD